MGVFFHYATARQTRKRADNPSAAGEGARRFSLGWPRLLRRVRFDGGAVDDLRAADGTPQHPPHNDGVVCCRGECGHGERRAGLCSTFFVNSRCWPGLRVGGVGRQRRKSCSLLDNKVMGVPLGRVTDVENRAHRSRRVDVEHRTVHTVPSSRQLWMLSSVCVRVSSKKMNGQSPISRPLGPSAKVGVARSSLAWLSDVLREE